MIGAGRTRNASGPTRRTQDSTSSWFQAIQPRSIRHPFLPLASHGGDLLHAGVDGGEPDHEGRSLIAVTVDEEADPALAESISAPSAASAKHQPCVAEDRDLDRPVGGAVLELLVEQHERVADI